MAKILVVDDDVEFIDSIKALLEGDGHSVVTAHNGAEGFDKAKKNKPELMLLDVMMTTDSEGFDIARKLHDDPETKGLPIIMVTGIRKAKSLPFKFEPDEDWLPVKAVLEKPVKPEMLLQNVRAALKQP